MRPVLIALACACLALLGANAAAAVDAPLEGRLLFVRDGDLWLWEGGQSRVMAQGGTWSQPRWAPDGASLAYVYRGTNFADLFVTDLNGENHHQLTTSQSRILEDNDWNFQPTWSPDGAQIAFVSDRSSTFPSAWVMNADGTRPRQVALTGVVAEGVDALAWSPDGTQLAVTLFDNANPTQIALVPVAPTPRQRAQMLTENPRGAFDPAWSPDGGWVAYAGREGFGVEIFAVRPDKSDTQRLTTAGRLSRSPAWSPDGQHLAYLSSNTGWFEVWVMDVTTDANGTLVVANNRQLTTDLRLDASSGLSWGR